MSSAMPTEYKEFVDRLYAKEIEKSDGSGVIYYRFDSVAYLVLLCTLEYSKNLNN